jgi:nitrate/nitrite transporter NarK
MVVNVYGLSFWVGEMVDQIDGIGDVAKGFVTAIPYAVAIVGMIVIPRYSDRTGERKAVVSVSLALAAAAFVVSTVVSPVAAIPALAIGLFFLLGVHGVFWTMPTAMLSGAAAAAGIAAINSIGNIGGFVGPYLVGLVKDATGSTDGGLITLAAILAIGSAIALKAAHEKELEPAPEETLARTGRFDRTGAREPAGQMAD